MNFVQTNHAVQCVRTHQESGRTVSEVVVSFDAQLSTIAPHVSALLSTDEINQLSAWLEERKQLQKELQDKPLGVAVLEALPGLVQEATEAVEQLEALDVSLHTQIEQSLRLFRTALNKASRSEHLEESNQFDSLQDEEVLKEQLASIKNKV
ncbi:hypothetical protein [Alkalimarinus sediminis]|uniref:Uncharacterized protein n=1 Tax=Alkalimarinus sediminis TaxID=1632866 RepID=A0A9E8HTG4_9ALTE|nr:hypothetical protein [Alkalimarinus sediminis]UZW75434.1 hypothetical protein NNL22_02185 [Alkalimarinus sediminis]